jgi:hypothetical protein
MTTTTKLLTVRDVLDEANPNDVDDALRRAKLGTTLRPLKRTFTGLTAAGEFDLTALDASGETTGVSNRNRLAALHVTTLRVTTETTGTDATGSYQITDASGTGLNPLNSTVVGLAKLSDDGKTITFLSTDVTGFVIEYVPRILQGSEWDASFTPPATNPPAA